MGRIRGLELQFNLIQKQLQSKEDCIVVALHCILINEELQCVGIGDDWPEQSTRLEGSELLPNNWNSNQDVYSIRYVSKDSKNRYLLKIVKAGQSMHVNVALNETKSATTSVKVSQFVSDTFGNYSETFLDLDSLVENFKENVLMKVSTVETSAKKECSISDSELPTIPAQPVMPNLNINRPTPAHSDPFSDSIPRPFPRIGGQDLDPFGRAEGGMLFDPRMPRGPPLGDFGVGIPGGLPRGAVPPGARFDPFGPPMPGGPRFSRPNPDHFRPPDDSYDYFM